jgi:hypothetical protein
MLHSIACPAHRLPLLLPPLQPPLLLPLRSPPHTDITATTTTMRHIPGVLSSLLSLMRCHWRQHHYRSCQCHCFHCCRCFHHPLLVDCCICPLPLKREQKQVSSIPVNAGIRTRVAQWCSVITLKIIKTVASAWASIGRGGITFVAVPAVLAAAISLGLGKGAARGREAASCRAGAAFDAAFATTLLAS